MKQIKNKSHLSLLILLFLYSSCIHHEPRPLRAFFKDGFTILAHRGASGRAPENTMAAFRLAARSGAVIELDVRLSADGIPVVIHDENLNRTTNGRGAVRRQELARLKALDAGSHFSPAFSGEKIPTLEEVFQKINRRVRIVLEIKFKDDAANAHHIVKKVIDLIKEKGREKNVLIASFNPFVLETTKKIDSRIFRGRIYGSIGNSDLPLYEKIALRNLFFNKNADPDLLLVEHLQIDLPYIERYHAHGYLIFAWTVNDPEEMERLISCGVDGIITDFPGYARGVYRQAVSDAKNIH